MAIVSHISQLCEVVCGILIAVGVAASVVTRALKRIARMLEASSEVLLAWAKLRHTIDDTRYSRHAREALKERVDAAVAASREERG